MAAFKSLGWPLWGFSSPKSQDPAELSDALWGERPSLFQQLHRAASALDDDFLQLELVLADQDTFEKEREEIWAAGARDGILALHTEPEKTEAIAAELFAKLKPALIEPSPQTYKAFYEAAKKTNAVEVFKPLGRRLLDETQIDILKIYDLAQFIATKAPDREPVKLALYLLAQPLASKRELGIDRIWITFARHEEFTHAAGWILACQKRPEWDSDLLSLANALPGWGKIACVELLAGSGKPEIEHWLLHQGYKNEIAPEYSATLCAKHGKLIDQLETSEIKQDTLTACSELMFYLVKTVFEPPASLLDYEHGAESALRFLDLMDQVQPDVAQLRTISALLLLVQNDDIDWPQLESKGWTEGHRGLLSGFSQAILDHPLNLLPIQNGFKSEDLAVLSATLAVAPFMGFDIWETLLDKIEQGFDVWDFLLWTEDERRLEKVLKLFEKHHDLNALGSGLKGEMTIDPDAQDFWRLGTLIANLSNFPSMGEPLIKVALKCPILPIRYEALSTLDSWGLSAWGKPLKEYVKACIDEEPVEEFAEAMRTLIEGGSLSELEERD